VARTIPNTGQSISRRLRRFENRTRTALRNWAEGLLMPTPVLRAVVVLAGLMLAGSMLPGCAGGGHTRAGSRIAASVPAPTDTPTAHATPAASAPALLLGEVRRELAAMRVTHYRHTTHVEEASGTFVYDCSGLVDYALGRVLPADAKALPVSTSTRALAGDIERYLHRGLAGPIAGWQAVARVDHLGPGDVVAWQATEDSTTGDTGHVMIVLGAPSRNPGRDEWLVNVADSTINPHAADSRRPGANGLGSGTIGLVVDQHFAATAFYWQGGVSVHAKQTEIALGRPQ
jgi:cell wall-associated NlpC family hydrolase